MLALMLTGCTSSPTVPVGHSASPTVPSGNGASPTTSPVSRVGDHIVIRGDGLDFADSAGGVVDSANFSDDAAETRDRITRWLGMAPVTNSVDNSSYCFESPAYVIDTWDSSLALIHRGPVYAAAGFRFSVLASGSKANGIDIVTPQGFGVGDPSDDLIAAVPATSVDMGAGVARVYYDLPIPEWSAYAWAWEKDGAPIQQIIAPYALEEFC